MNIEGILIECIRKVIAEYGGEWDDLYQQGYLIALERIDSYDKKQGASLETYMYHQIYGGLRDYCRRVTMKEDTMGGHRDNIDLDTWESIMGDTSSIDSQMEARDILENLWDALDDTDRIIITGVSMGFSMEDIGKQASMSKQAVSKRLKKIRELDYGL